MISEDRVIYPRTLEHIINHSVLALSNASKMLDQTLGKLVKIMQKLCFIAFLNYKEKLEHITNQHLSE